MTIEYVQTNVGVLGIKTTKRQTRPAGLRKPYEYILPLADTRELSKRLRDYLKDLAGQGKVQRAGLWTKSLSRGIRLNVFILGHRPIPELDSAGVTKEEWDAICQRTQQMIFDALGPDAQMHIEPYNEQRKFDARFETYIAYTEML